MAGVSHQWVFSESKLVSGTPSRKFGIDADKELSYRQQAANFIQDMGQRLQVSLLVINTAIVYMHRFYMFHSFTKFPRNNIAAACLFLAAKVDEMPRKLEHVLKVSHHLIHRDAPPLDIKSDDYLEKAQELVINENILLQTLGFDINIEHPHSFVVKTCDLVRASKDLTQTSYILATNSLHLTTMCLRFKPTVVSCVCIYLACKWASYEIPKSSEGKSWWTYVDKDVTEDQLEEICREFINILDKFPNRLKRAIQIAKGEKPVAEPASKGPKSSFAASHHEKSKSPAPLSSSSDAGKRHLHTATNHDRKQEHSNPPSQHDSKDVSPFAGKQSQTSIPTGANKPRTQGTPLDPSTHKTSYKEYKERKEREKLLQQQTGDFKTKLEDYKSRVVPESSKPRPEISTSTKPNLPSNKPSLPFEKYKEQKSHSQHRKPETRIPGHNPQPTSNSYDRPAHHAGTSVERQLDLSVHNQQHFNRLKQDSSHSLSHEHTRSSGGDKHHRHSSGRHHEHSRPSSDNSLTSSQQHSLKRTHGPAELPNNSTRTSSHKHSSSLPHSGSKKQRTDSSSHSLDLPMPPKDREVTGSSKQTPTNGNKAASSTGASDGHFDELNRQLQLLIQNTSSNIEQRILATSTPRDTPPIPCSFEYAPPLPPPLPETPPPPPPPL